MTTSGTAVFTIDRADILAAAYRAINVVSEGEPLTASMITTGAFQLNLLIKEWMSSGYQLWTDSNVTLFLTAGQAQYNLSSTGDHATTAYTEVALTGAAASGATTLTMPTGYAVGDYIGVMKDDNNLFWTTVASVGPLVLTDALDGDAASGNTVIYYTTKTNRPLRLAYARRRESPTNEVQVELISRQEYERQTDKTTQGTVVELFYNPDLTQGTLYVWPTAANSLTRLVLTVQRPIEDFTTAANTPDFPIEWGNALIWNLAEELAPMYGVSDQQYARVQQQAMRSLGRVHSFDRETTSIFLQPRFM